MNRVEAIHYSYNEIGKELAIQLGREVRVLEMPNNLEELFQKGMRKISIFKDMADDGEVKRGERRVVKVSSHVDACIDTVMFPENVRVAREVYMRSLPKSIKHVEFKGYLEDLEGTIRSSTNIKDSLETFKAKGIREISEIYFEGCTNLRTVDGNGSIYKIGLGAFQNCWKLDVQGVINQNVYSIGECAFDECVSSSGELEIPESVSVVSDMFIGYMKNLKRVEFRNVGLMLEDMSEEEFNVSHIVRSAFDNRDGYDLEVIVPDGMCVDVVDTLVSSINSAYELEEGTDFRVYLNTKNTKSVGKIDDIERKFFDKVKALDGFKHYCRGNLINIENLEANSKIVEENISDKEFVDLIEKLLQKNKETDGVAREIMKSVRGLWIKIGLEGVERVGEVVDRGEYYEVLDGGEKRKVYKSRASQIGYNGIDERHTLDRSGGFSIYAI